jgi:hypothetical protein
MLEADYSQVTIDEADLNLANEWQDRIWVCVKS